MKLPEPGKLTPQRVRRLARSGESDIIEFKGRNSSTEDIVSAAVCFANAEGGLILSGIEDDGAIRGSRIKDAASLTKTVFHSTSPSQRVQVQAITVDGAHVIGIWVRAASLLVSTTKGSYTVRLGTECIPMTPDRIQIRLIDTGDLDLSAALTPVGVEAIDFVEVDRFRRALPDDEPSDRLRRLGAQELLEAVGALQLAEAGQRLLTVGGLLMFGSEPQIRQLMPQHELVYFRSTAGTTDYERRVISSAPILALLERTMAEVAAATRVRTFVLGAQQIELPDYPERVVREAVVNGLAHRHYRLSGAVVIRHTAGGIEFDSPGGFPEGVTEDSVIQHAPVHRNRHLCDLLERVRFMERSGLGVDRIFEDQLRFGKLPPTYSADRNSVRLRLDATSYDEPVARFVISEERRGRRWTVEQLLIVSYLRRMGPTDREALAGIVQRDEAETQELLNLLRGDLIERFGSGNSVRYALSAPVQVALGAEATYTRERGLTLEYQRGIVLQHAVSFGRIDNPTVRQLLGVSRREATVLLLSLGRRGMLRQEGERRWATWVPTGTEPAS